MNRRGDKIIEIEKYLTELEEFFPSDFEKYAESDMIRAACERYFEKIVEAVVDLAFIIIKEKSLGSPESSREAFQILSKNGIISSNLSVRLGDAKAMRNWLAHRYGKVNDKLVFDSMNNKLSNDVGKFLDSVR